MDPVTVIVAALVSGAAAALKDTTGEAVKDAYASLKTLLKRRFAGRPEADIVLEKHQEKPDVWDEPLREALKESGADTDEEIVRAAQRVLTIVHPEQSAQGKYSVQITGAAQGNVFGDQAVVTQSFEAPQDPN
jgi:hypothetical protein